MKVTLKVFLVCLALMAGSELKAQKMAVLWLRPTLNYYQASNLANYDLIVLDFENKFNNSASIDTIIAHNPKTKILYYWNYVEWFQPMFPDKPWSIDMLAQLEKKPGYWLKQSNKKPVVFWKDMKMMNVTTHCPKIKGKTYNNFIFKPLIADILSDPRCQGIYIDNLWKTLDWLAKFENNKSIDADNNGRPDGAEDLNLSFQREARKFLKEIRKKMGSDFLIISNPINDVFLDLVDGKNSENFPDRYLDNLKNDGWDITMKYLDNGKAYNIINARQDNLMYAMASALLFDNDVYVSWDQNTPWNKDFQLKLGAPTTKKREVKKDIYKRVFENGVITVDVVNKQASIKYKDGRIKNSFDSISRR